MRSLGLVLAFLLLGSPGLAAPLASADKARLEGVWRLNANAASDACGRDGQFAYGIEITIEFKLTGGEIYFEDQAEGSGGDRIVSATKEGEVVSLALAHRSPAWKIRFSGNDKAAFDGREFVRCDAGEARPNIHLARDDMAYLATGLVPAGTEPYYGVKFVDSRAAGGCKAKLYQAIAFDLRTPTFPAIRRIESEALKLRLESGKKPGVAIDPDGMGRWAVDGAVATATGWRFTIVELIPPNGSRGDRTTLDVMRTKGGISIPAWQRSYLRCG